MNLIIGIAIAAAIIASVIVEWFKEQDVVAHIDIDNQKDMYCQVIYPDGSYLVVLSYMAPSTKKKLEEDAKKLDAGELDAIVMPVTRSALYPVKDYFIELGEWAEEAWNATSKDLSQIGITVVGAVSRLAYIPLRLLSEFGLRTRRRVVIAVTKGTRNMSTQASVVDHVTFVNIIGPKPKEYITSDMPKDGVDLIKMDGKTFEQDSSIKLIDMERETTQLNVTNAKFNTIPLDSTSLNAMQSQYNTNVALTSLSPFC